MCALACVRYYSRSWGLSGEQNRFVCMHAK